MEKDIQSGMLLLISRGKVYQNQNARQSCDFYHRYTEDIKLLKQLGISHFRFSLSWQRIFLDDSGKLNDRGMDYYQKVVDTCLETVLFPGSRSTTGTYLGR